MYPVCVAQYFPWYLEHLFFIGLSRGTISQSSVSGEIWSSPCDEVFNFEVLSLSKHASTAVSKRSRSRQALTIVTAYAGHFRHAKMVSKYLSAVNVGNRVRRCLAESPRSYSPFLRTGKGFYAGYVASAYAFGRFVGGYATGRVADSIGRKPVIIGGLLSIMVFSLAFGLSPTFSFAVASRWRPNSCACSSS